MTNRNEGITIYLTIGKEVKLNFDSENNLSSIRLSINKVAELFGNKVVNEESIFYVSTVALVTKSNYKTFISVVGGKQVISGDAVYEEVMIDQERTSNKRGNKKFAEKKLLASDNLRPDLTKEKIVSVAKNQEKQRKRLIEGYKHYENKLNRLIDVQEILQELERNGLFDLRGYRVIDREEKLTDKIEKYEKEVEETQQKNAKEKRKEREI
ncbi:hypothetical protein N8A33_002693 [Enterococcus hirae]|nr:hypothetical protein [Enterococcus hirae]EMF0533633.1 hypothetical protein [Enterococcus hirae]